MKSYYPGWTNSNCCKDGRGIAGLMALAEFWVVPAIKIPPNAFTSIKTRSTPVYCKYLLIVNELHLKHLLQSVIVSSASQVKSKGVHRGSSVG